MAFPNFAEVLSLIGCACDMTICFILPALMHAIVSLDRQSLLRGPSFAALLTKTARQNGGGGGGGGGPHGRRSGPALWFLIAVDAALIVIGFAGMILGISATLKGRRRR